MIASGAVDAVIILIPHYDHPLIAVDCFRTGLNVLCEKPAGVYSKAVLEMLMLKTNLHLKTVVSLCYHFQTEQE